MVLDVPLPPVPRKPLLQEPFSRRLTWNVVLDVRQLEVFLVGQSVVAQPWMLRARDAHDFVLEEKPRAQCRDGCGHPADQEIDFSPTQSAHVLRSIGETDLYAHSRGARGDGAHDIRKEHM